MDVLKMFTESRTVLSAADVAQELGTSRSTTYRYLQSLRSYGFLEEDEHGGFRLGPTIFDLARIARKGLGLSEISVPLMQDLARRLDEAVVLTRRVGSQVVTIEREESSSPIRLSYERGHLFPVHAGASARILLAFAPESEFEQILSTTRLDRFTDRTITDPDELRKSLKTVREKGYAISRGEVDEGVLAVAAPILNKNGGAVAGLTAVTLEARMSRDKLPVVIKAVQECAADIGARFESVQS